MGKFLAGLGAICIGFGFYNLLFTVENVYLSSDWLIPYLNIRYSTLTTETASYIFIGVGFAIIVLGVILGNKKNKY